MDTPQELLNQIHATGIFMLDGRKLETTEARVEQARRLRPELRAIRTRVETAQQALKAHKNRNATVPYRHLEEILDRLEQSLREFLTDPTVKIPFYGTTFFGDTESGEWHIGTPQQAQTWQLERQEAALAEHYANLEVKVEAARKKLKSAQHALFLQKEEGRGIRLMVIGAVLLVAGIAAALATQIMPLLAISTVGVLLLVIGVIRYRRWNTRTSQIRTQAEKLRATVQALTEQLDSLRAKHARVVERLRQIRAGDRHGI